LNVSFSFDDDRGTGEASERFFVGEVIPPPNIPAFFIFQPFIDDVEVGNIVSIEYDVFDEDGDTMVFPETLWYVDGVFKRSANQFSLQSQFAEQELTYQIQFFDDLGNQERSEIRSLGVISADPLAPTEVEVFISEVSAFLESFPRLTDLILSGTNDTFGFGNALDNTITGNVGANTLAGLDGADVLRGGAGDDTITGDNGDDRMFGNGGVDRLLGGAGVDLIKGGGGGDFIKGGGDADVIVGNGGADRLFGGGGTDSIKGGGADELIGGGGADTISGNGGDDTLKGNGGADVFVFRASDRNDTISDFRQGQDSIQIQSGANSFTGLNIEQDGSDVFIGFGAGQVRVVTDNVGAFDESDFIF
jgi:Ca2+-binding RTX toxin-like protein